MLIVFSLQTPFADHRAVVEKSIYVVSFDPSSTRREPTADPTYNFPLQFSFKPMSIWSPLLKPFSTEVYFDSAILYCTQHSVWEQKSFCFQTRGSRVGAV